MEGGLPSKIVNLFYSTLILFLSTFFILLLFFFCVPIAHSMLLLFHHCVVTMPNAFAKSLEPQMNLNFVLATVNTKSIYIRGLGPWLCLENIESAARRSF